MNKPLHQTIKEEFARFVGKEFDTENLVDPVMMEMETLASQFHLKVGYLEPGQPDMSFFTGELVWFKADSVDGSPNKLRVTDSFTLR